MTLIRSWLIIIGKFLAYFRYRLGFGEMPTFLDRPEEALRFLNSFLFWSTRMRNVNPERCVKTNPAVFVGNHMKLDDPLFVYRAVYLATNGEVHPRGMGRDDFFNNTPLKNPLFDIDELMVMAGGQLITRDSVQLSHMKPFIKFLRNNESFLMFPGRTRSKSGCFVEYPGDFKEPGGGSFFAAQALRGKPPITVPVVPVVRTFNPVNKQSAMVFGEPMYLPEGAGRTVQREFDLLAMEVLGKLVELNVPQVLSAMLYLRCLHGLETDIPLPHLQADLEESFGSFDGYFIDPAAHADLAGEMKRSLDYLASKGALKRKGAKVTLNTDAILSVPEINSSYRKKNPVKYLANQVLHLVEVVVGIERVTLGLQKPDAPPSETTDPPES